MTPLACEGSTQALTTLPLVGSPGAAPGTTLTPGTEQVGPGEIRVTILGSGDPFVRPSQASASVLVEVGNATKDLFFFDLGSGALIERHWRVPGASTEGGVSMFGEDAL